MDYQGAKASGDATSSRPTVGGTENNFDLLRLLAAAQVFHFHATESFHLKYGPVATAVTEVLNFFPGVPIFFVISGFLISLSYERSLSASSRTSAAIRSYARNRFLRIYPGLWVCFAVTVLLLAFAGQLTRGFLRSEFIPWVMCQLTFFQAFNPSHLRGYGLGVINGSLWTIPVELSFYVALPVLYWLTGRMSRRASDVIFGALAIASLIIAFANPRFIAPYYPFPSKVLHVTPIPHIYMFLFGVLAQRNFGRIRGILEGKVVYWTAATVGSMWVDLRLLDHSLENSFLFVLCGRLLLTGFALSFAFSARSVSRRLLRHQDISYGIYIYHALFINAFIAAGIGGLSAYALAAVGALAAGMISWRLVESRALRRKRGAVVTMLPSATTSKDGTLAAATPLIASEPPR
ncbi:MAG TPA: acyltransferase [Polyangiaceae bacterium]|jgi:peptidoglycan/LPS O-acetylase OafA/YrhL